MINCIKCGRDIPDNALFCQFCGKKQIVDKKKQPRSRRGTGSVSYHKSSGKYLARMSINGKQVSLGYFKTEQEAWRAIHKLQVEQNYSLSYNWTVEDCYNKWSEKHYQTLSSSAEASYKNAWRYFSKIKRIKMRDIKTSHIQSCVDLAASSFSRSVCEKVKSLGSMLCKFAMKDDLINKNYALLVELPPDESEETNPFTDVEIVNLFKNDEDEDVKVILMMIYCGFRPTEFLSLQLFDIDLQQGFIRGGFKTEAGKNRIVPIHPSVAEYYQYFFKIAKKKGSTYLVSNEKGCKYRIDNWRKRHFYPALIRTKILISEDDKHVTPYSCRHTFATLCDRAGINDNMIIKMIGHTSKKTTDKFYIHQTERDMAEALKLLKTDSN